MQNLKSIAAGIAVFGIILFVVFLSQIFKIRAINEEINKSVRYRDSLVIINKTRLKVVNEAIKGRG